MVYTASIENTEWFQLLKVVECDSSNHCKTKPTGNTISHYVVCNGAKTISTIIRYFPADFNNTCSTYYVPNS